MTKDTSFKSDWNQYDHQRYQQLHDFLKANAVEQNALGVDIIRFDGTMKELADALGWQTKTLGITHRYMASAKKPDSTYICELVHTPNSGNGIVYVSPYETDYAITILELAQYVATGFNRQGKQVASWIEGLAERSAAVAASARTNRHYDAWRALLNEADDLIEAADAVRRAMGRIASYVQ